jgi:hypothetical protein
MRPAMEPPPAAPATPRSGLDLTGALIAWGLSLALLGGLAMAAWQQRAAITAAWPAAGRAYAWVEALL